MEKGKEKAKETDSPVAKTENKKSSHQKAKKIVYIYITISYIIFLASLFLKFDTWIYCKISHPLVQKYKKIRHENLLVEICWNKKSAKAW